LDIFLDTSILIDAIEDTKLKSLLNHAKNKGYILVTSLTVYGELIAVCNRKNIRDELIEILDLIKQFDIQCSLPNSQLRECCKCLDKMDKDMRVNISDRTHLAYSMAYDDDYFLTNDQHLWHFPLHKFKCGKATKTEGKIISPGKLKEILKK